MVWIAKIVYLVCLVHLVCSVYSVFSVFPSLRGVLSLSRQGLEVGGERLRLRMKIEEEVGNKLVMGTVCCGFPPPFG